MSLETLVMLGAASYLTAVLSAVVGLAGGMTLLAAMLLFFDPLIALPLHGVIQLVSNGSRSWFQREHIEWWILKYFGILMVPTAMVGLFVGRELSPGSLKLAIGVFVLLATWRPSWLLFGVDPGSIDPRRRFLGLGGAIGFLNMTVGATGPFSAPFFLGLGLTRHALVGTKAAAQMLGHGVKVLLFAVSGFAFAEYGTGLLWLCACVVAGSYTGARLLDRLSESLFDKLYRGVLTVIALRLILDPTWSALVGSP